jgi:hypothetical protein
MIMAMIRVVEPIGSGRLTAAQTLRHWGNWINLSTPVGLLVSRIGSAKVNAGRAVSTWPRATGCRSRSPPRSPSATW